MRLTSWQMLVLVAAVAVAGGLAGVRSIQRQFELRTRNSAELSAQLIASLVVFSNVTEDAAGKVLIGAEGRARADAGVKTLQRRGQLVGLEIWSLEDGHLIYADPEHPDTEPVLPAREWERARRGSFIEYEPTGRTVPTLDVFIPYDPASNGTAEAIVEVLLPGDPINAAIAGSTRLLYAGAAGLAALGTLVVWTTRRRHRREQHAARHDQLTGLGNRALLAERATEALAAAGADGQVALLLIDLDRFKEVNDTLGHHAGDDLLIAVGHRLRAACRATDTVTRLGGDEFAVILPGLPGPDSAVDSAHRLREALREPIVVLGLNVDVDASIGVALSPDHGTDLSTLLRCADVAMYAAKNSGGNVAVYDPGTDSRDEEQLTVLSELRHGIAAEQLRLHYQPKCDTSGEVNDVEALVRWQHPRRGLLGPAAFLPLAERTALIKQLTTWVLTEAARQCAAWRAAGHDLNIAVNVSPRNLDDDLPDTLLEAVTAVGLPPSALHIEITETAVATDPARAEHVVTKLRAMGVRISIDDFGTGYTSLSQLATLPVGVLKIDRHFVADLLDNQAHDAVIRSIVQLARQLGIQTVAEGVETPHIWARLNDLGCDQIQGYVLTPPLPPDQLLHWINTWPGTTPIRPEPADTATAPGETRAV